MHLVVTMQACSVMWWHQKYYSLSTKVFAVIYPHKWVEVYADYKLWTAHRFYVFGSFDEDKSESTTDIVAWLNYYLISVFAHVYLPSRLFWWPTAAAVHLFSGSSIPHGLIRPTSTDVQSFCIIQAGLSTMQTPIPIADNQDSHCNCFYGDDPSLMHQLCINSSNMLGVCSLRYYHLDR